jgi:hypothetical protein
MKAIPSDSGVKLRIRRPEQKTRKIVNMDKWLSAGTGRAGGVGVGEDLSLSSEVVAPPPDDEYVDVHVVFSMPLKTEG